MAGYDYNYRSGYSNGKGGGPHKNEWNKTSYTDGECRTVIVDADGTRRTIIGCTPFHKPESYVTKTETIIHERILSPAKEYGYADDKWRRPSSPAKGFGYVADDHKTHRPSSPPKGYGYAADDLMLHRPSSPTKSYGYAVGDHYPRRPSSPAKSYGYAVGDHYPRKPSSPVKGYGYSADHHQLHRPSSPENDYPREVSDFLTKVQTEASREQPANWHQPPPKAAHNGTYGDYNNKTSYKPNGNTIRNDNHDEYLHKYYSGMGPNTMKNGGHQPRPSHSAWTPQPGHEGRLSSATDDIETALRYLMESTKSSSATVTTPQYSHYSAVPKQDQYPTGAAKRNVRFNAP